MAMPSGTKKWTTLAAWNDRDVVSYFMEMRGQRGDHALNSLKLLRAQFTSDGSRRVPPLMVHEVNVSADAIERSKQGANAAPERQRYPHGGPIAVKLDPRIMADMVDVAKAMIGDKWEMQEADLVNADAQPEPEPEQADAAPENNAPKFEAPQIAEQQKDPAGAALAAMIVPHMGDKLAPMVKEAVEAMHSHLQKHQAQQLVIVRDKVETKLEGSHHNAAPKIIKLVGQGLNVMLVGPAGCGKTVLASSVAKAYSRTLTCISCSGGMSEAQLLGRLLPLGDNGAFSYVESPFVKAYANGGVILLDEMDAADANLLLVINAALANGAIDIEARAASGLDTRVIRHPDTIVIAAANTWGSGADTQYIGRGALDVSTLDRFYRLAIDYDEALERQMGDAETVAWVQVLRRKARDAKLRRVVSSRMIQRVTAAKAAGVAFKEARRDELQSWTADERTKVGEAA